MRRTGVLWSGEHIFEGTVETLELLRSKGIDWHQFMHPASAPESQGLIIRVGKQIVFVTNNSTKSRADYKKKLESMGIPASV
ncbi:MAG: hypothetical protein Q9222_000841, partial [Ikaeria aurantiellina]